MRRRWLALALSVAAPLAAQAGDPIVAARAAGIVGERSDGFLGIARPAAADAALVRAVQAVNIKRRALYLDLAERRGVTPADVALFTGCTLLARVQEGEAYRLEDGAWRWRRAGEALRLPELCTRG